MNVRLIWDYAALSKRKKQFEVAQNYIDSESLRLMLPYVPVGHRRYRNSGALKNSGRIYSPGVIVFTSRFARHDYYNKGVDHRHGGNPNATALWFETMKAKHGRAILRGAAAIVGGKAK